VEVFWRSILLGYGWLKFCFGAISIDMVLGRIGTDYSVVELLSVVYEVGILDRLPWGETDRVVSYGYEIFGASKFNCVYEFELNVGVNFDV
jgi:hypothetical protein